MSPDCTLTRPNSNADQILRSGETKLLNLHFLHDVTAEQARTAWREGFEQNCPTPCPVNPAAMAKFIAAVPAMRKGETFSFIFTGRGVEITAAGRLIGNINDRQFADLILASFIGARPPTPRLKRELLGLPLDAWGLRRPSIRRSGRRAGTRRAHGLALVGFRPCRVAVLQGSA